MLHKLAAIKIVRELELQMATLDFTSSHHNSYYGRRTEESSSKDKLKKEIVKLAVTHGKIRSPFPFSTQFQRVWGKSRGT